MPHALFSHNPEYCVDIIHAHKPAFTPRVAFILGSGLGALADQIEDAVAISYEKLPGFPVSTVHGHAGELVLGHLAGVPVACMKGRGHFYEGRGMAVMTDAIRTLKLLGCELLFCTNCGEAIIFALIGDATNSSSNQQWRDLRGNLGILHCAEKNDLKMIFLHWILHLNDFRLNRFKSTFNHCPNS